MNGLFTSFFIRSFFSSIRSLFSCPFFCYLGEIFRHSLCHYCVSNSGSVMFYRCFSFFSVSTYYARRLFVVFFSNTCYKCIQTKNIYGTSSCLYQTATKKNVQSASLHYNNIFRKVDKNNWKVNLKSWTNSATFKSRNM